MNIQNTYHNLKKNVDIEHLNTRSRGKNKFYFNDSFTLTTPGVPHRETAPKLTKVDCVSRDGLRATQYSGWD